ncbi:MAG: hypothetical protein Q8R40_04095 [bacterium]|nr:hypothetical protein [bacterium]
MQSFDLIGLDIRKKRAQQKVTVLRRVNGHWSTSEIEILVVHTRNSVSSHPMYPEVLLLPGELLREHLMALIQGEFEYTVVEGMDNPAMPFKPQFI